MQHPSKTLGLRYLNVGGVDRAVADILRCVVCRTLALLPCRVHPLGEDDVCPAVCCHGACSALLLTLPCPACALPADPVPRPDAAYCRLLEDRVTAVCCHCNTQAGARALLRHPCPLGRLWSLMVYHHPMSCSDEASDRRETVKAVAALHHQVPEAVEAWLLHDWIPRCTPARLPHHLSGSTIHELCVLINSDWFGRLWTKGGV